MARLLVWTSPGGKQETSVSAHRISQLHFLFCDTEKEEEYVFAPDCTLAMLRGNEPNFHCLHSDITYLLCGL